MQTAGNNCQYSETDFDSDELTHDWRTLRGINDEGHQALAPRRSRYYTNQREQRFREIGYYLRCIKPILVATNWAHWDAPVYESVRSIVC
jgi:hypothetical protein